MIIRINEQKYSSVENYYKKSVLNDIIKRYNNFKSNHPNHKVFVYLNSNMLGDIIIKNPFSGVNNSFLDGYFKTVSLIEMKHSLFKSIWDSQKKDLGKFISKIDFYQVCRYYSIKQFNNLLINRIISNNNKAYLKNQKEYDKLIKLIVKELDSYKDALDEIFDYKNTITTKKRAELLKKIGIDICPYCHRQFINSYMIDGKNRVIAQLDHYIPKDKYPLYALSLYNFIPSCAHCNTVQKKEKVFPLLSPICSTKNKSKIFSINYLNYQTMIGNKKDFEIKIINPEINLFEKGIRDYQIKSFAIENIYNYHNYVISDLLRKKSLHNNEYKDFLSSFKSIAPLSNKEFLEILFGFNLEEEELYQKPLSKLAHDIIQ